MAAPNDGVYVPLKFDLGPAQEQLDKFKETVSSTDVRPNAALENFFAGVATDTAAASKNISDMLRKLQSMKASGGLQTTGAMNMAALAARSAPVGPKFNPFAGMTTSPTGTMYRALPNLVRPQSYSNRYQEIATRGDTANQSRYEAGFQNRYLEREIGSGDMMKRIKATLQAEAAAKKLQRQNDRLIAQTRLMERQAKYGRIGGLAAHAIGENRERIGQIAGAAGRVGMGVGAGIAGLTASGYSGTIEGERFSRELRGLSLELAAAFKPLMDAATNLTRYSRQKMQSLDTNQQDLLMRGGTAIGGAVVGSKIGGLAGARGRVIGGLVGARLGYDSPEAIETIKKGEGIAGGAFKLATSDTLKKILQPVMDLLDFGPFAAIKQTKRFYDDVKTFSTDTGAQNLGGFGKIASAALAGQTVEPANQNRRQLMLTEGTGFSDAGSTFMALQEDLIRTQAAQDNPVVTELKGVREEIAKLNR